MTKHNLEARTKKVLAEMARRERVAGWRAMSKEELVSALSKQARPSRTRKVVAKRKVAATRKVAAAPRKRPLQTQVAAARNTSPSNSAEEQVERSKYEVGIPTKDLSDKVPKDLPAGYGRDRIVVMVRDPYWLHTYWELTRHAVQRAEAALGQDWHGARPILRLLDVSARDTANSAEAVVRDIDIHGGCNNWYIDVANPPRSYRVDIGYLSRRGRF
jgi:hypothetical protein